MQVLGILLVVVGAIAFSLGYLFDVISQIKK